MIRFRFREDETRFMRLHGEMFERIARAGLPGEVGSEAMRNVGKIETMAFMEGLRQGLAMAALVTEFQEREFAAFAEPFAQKAFQLHALIYGSSDTPLRAVEKEWLVKAESDEKHMAGSWLDDKPMRYAPATLREIDGTEPPIAPMVSVQSATKPVPVRPPTLVHPQDVREFAMSEPDRLPPPEAMHGAEVTVPEPWQKGEYEVGDDPELDAIIQRSIDKRLADPEPIGDSPDFLDLVRETINSMKKDGWKPTDWSALVFDLHIKMQADAGFIDLQLSTPLGRTVLDQCGLLDVMSPGMVSMEMLLGRPAP